MTKKTVRDVDVDGKRVFVRVDLVGQASACRRAVSLKADPPGGR